jgi:hypothetical protein
MTRNAEVTARPIPMTGAEMLLAAARTALAVAAMTFPPNGVGCHAACSASSIANAGALTPLITLGA